MSLTREDMLRELGLLPVWRLKKPLANDVACATTPLTQAAPTVSQIENVDVVVAQAPSFASSAIKHPLQCLISDDKKWVFIWAGSRMDIGLQTTLFNNILLALRVNKTIEIPVDSISEAKVIVVMGETAAQLLCNNAESIESLRGKTHTFQNIPLIVTYHPHDILQNMANKAKTWDDLCMAMEMLHA